MKTNMIKTAAFTLAMVISISVSAQNTKSFRANKIGDKLDKLVKENKAELSNALNNLKSFVQFRPEANIEFTADANDAVIDLSGLESMVKYSPAHVTSSSIPVSSNEMESVLTELKEMVQYKPQNQVTESNEEFKKIAEELAVIVRYKPQS